MGSQTVRPNRVTEHSSVPSIQEALALNSNMKIHDMALICLTLGGVFSFNHAGLLSVPQTDLRTSLRTSTNAASLPFSLPFHYVACYLFQASVTPTQNGNAFVILYSQLRFL